MTDLVALFSPDEGLRIALGGFLNALGLRVLDRPTWPCATPDAQVVFADMRSLPEGAPKKLAARLRGQGCELVFLGDWRDSEALSSLGHEAGVKTLSVPLHPRELLPFVTLREPGSRPTLEQRRLTLADLAGLLYQQEGVCFDDLQRFDELVQQRLLERSLPSLRAYRELLAKDAAELCLMAEYGGDSAGLLFGPSILYSLLLGRVIPQLPEAAKVLSVGDESARQAIALSMLFGGGARVDFQGELPVGPLPKTWLGRVAQSLRSTVLAGLDESGALKTDFRTKLCSLVAGEGLSEGCYDLILAPRVDLDHEPAELEASLRTLADALAPGGWLVLGPGERVLFQDWALRPVDLNPLGAYRRPLEER